MTATTATDGIHEGFFGDIPDAEYPSPVAFAFFDGDLYSSIYQSFEKVWPKLSHGGVVVVHDYGDSSRFPGAKAATEAYLQNVTHRTRGAEECYDLFGKVTKHGRPWDAAHPRRDHHHQPSGGAGGGAQPAAPAGVDPGARRDETHSPLAEPQPDGDAAAAQVNIENQMV